MLELALKKKYAEQINHGAHSESNWLSNNRETNAKFTPEWKVKEVTEVKHTYERSLQEPK